MNKKALFAFITLTVIILSISIVAASDTQQNLTTSTNNNDISNSYNLSKTVISSLETNTNYNENVTTENNDNSEVNNKDQVFHESDTSNINNTLVTSDQTTYNSSSTKKSTITNNTTTINSSAKSTSKLESNSSIVYFNASTSNDNGNGSETNPFKTITQSRLNSLENNTTIYIANGIYNVSSITISTNLNIIGENTNNTILTGQSINSRMFTIYSTANVSISNLTMVNTTRYTLYNQGTLTLNNIILSNNKGSNGSAIYNSKYLYIINSLIVNNTATNYGGVIYSTSSGSILYIENSKFINNTAKYGGVIYVYNTTTTLNKNYFNNDYSSSMGGVIYSLYSTIIINSSTFINDSSTNNIAGAIYSKNTNLTITNTNFTNNTAKIGGTIAQLENILTIDNSNFINNTATSYGGAIYNIYSKITIDNSNFTNNKAESGGAIYTDDASNYFTVTRSNFINNTATSYGGAIYSNQNRIIITNNTFNDNKAMNNTDLYIQNNITSTITNNNWSSNITITNNADPTTALTSIVNSITVTSTSTNTTLPSSYDLRDYGYVSAVEDQGTGGSCWAFGTIASLESCLLKQTGFNYTFSVNNMKNLLAYYSQYGWNIQPNEGGYFSMSIAYLTSWLGPILASTEEYDEADTVSAILNTTLHIQNIYGLTTRSSYTDNDAIKEAILKYGSVFSDMYMDTSYLNYNTNGYYYNNQYYGTNHIISIVGWDDNYSRYNFDTTPAGDGAFIVKNSWGTDWGDDGYFYVSYYDTAFTEIFNSEYPTSFVFAFNNSDYYTTNYQYDIGGQSDWIISNSNTGWYTNLYTSVNNEVLTAFGTYFYEVENYTAYIYVNNILNSTQSGTNSYAGYNTIKLNQNVTLNTGDSFEIILKITTNDNSRAYIPIETPNSVRIVTNAKQSYVGNNGRNWYDLYNTTYNGISYKNTTACLKAYTTSTTTHTLSTISKTNTEIVINSITGIVGDTVTIQANITDESGNKITGGKVVFKINGTTLKDSDGNVIYINVTNGIAQLNYTIPYTWAKDNLYLTAIYSGTTSLYNSANSTKTLVNITKRTATLTLTTNTKTLLSGQTIRITAKLTDNNTYITSGLIVFKINGITIKDSNGNPIIVNVTNGIAQLNYTLPNGMSARTYNITAVFSNNNYNRAETNTSFNIQKMNTTITLNSITTTAGSTVTVIGTIKDIYNNNIVGKTKISIKINGITIGNYYITNGTIKTNITIPSTYKARNYTLSVISGETNAYNTISGNTTLTIEKVST